MSHFYSIDFDSINRTGKNNHECSKNKREKLNSKASNFVMGTLISLIPLIVLPLFKMLIGETVSCLEFFGSPTLLFIGISSLISVLNDFFETPNFKEKKEFTNLCFFLAIVGIFAFSITTVAEYCNDTLLNVQTMSSNVLPFLPAIINVFYLLVVFSICVTKYRRFN